MIHSKSHRLLLICSCELMSDTYGRAKAEVWNRLHVNRAKYITKRTLAKSKFLVKLAQGKGFEARNTSIRQLEIPRDLSKKGHSTINDIFFCFHITMSLFLRSYLIHELRSRNIGINSYVLCARPTLTWRLRKLVRKTRRAFWRFSLLCCSVQICYWEANIL